MHSHLRIARPVTDLQRSVRQYCQGLDLRILGQFEDHQGFDGVMLGHAEQPYHFEFTCCRAHPVAPSPTAEDLLVFYVPARAAWEAACQRLLAAGFVQVAAFNPYWEQHGRTFIDEDGYRVVLAQAAWNSREQS